jgi:hypothetical protein
LKGLKTWYLIKMKSCQIKGQRFVQHAHSKHNEILVGNVDVIFQLRQRLREQVVLKESGNIAG